MDNLVLYKVMSKVYDLLDIIYFTNNNRNPRKALNAIAIAKRFTNSKIVAIDISKEMLHIANKEINMNGLDNIKLYKMDATNTTFKNNTFDVIVISLVLHEIPKDLARKILLEAKRVLKPEGKILVMEWEEPQKLFKKVLFYPIRKLEPKGFEQFLEEDMKSYFEQFDLEITEMKHCDYTKVLQIRKCLS